ncbi:hypothetical protein PCANB_001995 [Pneumocystis canis]|nr:hypothetical protein PCK1_001740 [Pneumocystis canis]KAG5439421.1 hypothetical protein PCANB_001995 [Pneumocystis canis]
MKNSEYKVLETKDLLLETTNTLSSTVEISSTSKDQTSNKDSIDAAYDIVSMVDSLLGQLSHKFDALSQEILERMNKMTEQLDTLEISLNEMLTESQSAKMNKEIEERHT